MKDKNTAAAQTYLREKCGAYRGHPEWRALEQAFLAGAESACANQCLHQIQELPTKTEALAHYSQQAILAMGEAAHTAVAVPDGWKLVPCEPQDMQQAAGAQAIRFDTTLINKMWTANKVYREMVASAPECAALAATPAAAASMVNAETVIAAPVELLERVIDSLSSFAGNKPHTEADMTAWEQLNNLLSAAAAPVVLPEPDAQAQRAEGINQVVKMLQKRADAYADEHLSTDPDTGATEGSEAHIEYWNWLLELVDDVRALLAVVSAPAAPEEQPLTDDDAADLILETAREFWGVIAPCGEGVLFRKEADARWTQTGEGAGSDGFGVPTIGESFRECYEDKELELVRVHIAAAKEGAQQQ